MAPDRAALPTDVRGKDRVDDRRVISGILHVLRSGCRWSDCPPEYGPPTTIYNRFVALGGAWRVGASVPRTRRSRPIVGDADDRCNLRQGAPLGVGRKRGEQTQAIGRSRGGRNTKIHEIADAKGRLLSILLTGGEAHDCPPAKRLIRRARAARKMLGDKAYDSAELRHWLEERGTKIVIPNKANRKQPFSFDKNPTRSDIASRTPSAGSKISAASPLATTDWHETSSPPSALSQLSYGGF